MKCSMVRGKAPSQFQTAGRKAPSASFFTVMRTGAICVVSLLLCSAARAETSTVEGFTEPYRKVRVAASEAGILTQTLVSEGERVEAGQPIARLDDELYRVALEIARQQFESRGRLNAATAELNLHNHRLEKLLELRRAGQAHQEEVDRAQAEVEIAQAKLLMENEQHALARLELDKVQVQLDRRTIVAPFSGTVLSLEKHEGEYISPIAPDILTLAQLDPLRATFLVSRQQARRLRRGQSVTVVLPDDRRTITGTVDFVAQVTDAESGTVTVRVRLENPDGKLFSGEPCILQIP